MFNAELYLPNFFLGIIAGITETDRMEVVLIGMQNRTFGPYWQPIIGSSLQ
jgi:hypothetical protein